MNGYVSVSVLTIYSNGFWQIQCLLDIGSRFSTSTGLWRMKLLIICVDNLVLPLSLGESERK